jgi:hypothetical protein
MKALALGGLIACWVSLPVRADCVAPQPPAHLPSGATASREDMAQAIQAIRDYEAAVKEFSDCARHAHDEMLMQTADRAVDKLRAIADKFNFELYAFRKRNVT